MAKLYICEKYLSIYFSFKNFGANYLTEKLFSSVKTIFKVTHKTNTIFLCLQFKCKTCLIKINILNLK